MNPRDVYIDHFPKTVNQLLKEYRSGSLIIPQVPEQYGGEPVEQILLGTFRNEFLFTRSRTDMKLTLRTNIPFMRSVIQFADNQRVANESSFYPMIQERSSTTYLRSSTINSWTQSSAAVTFHPALPKRSFRISSSATTELNNQQKEKQP